MWNFNQLRDNGKLIAIFNPSVELELALGGHDADILAITLHQHKMNVRSCWLGSEEDYQELIKKEVYRKRAAPPSSFFDEYSKLILSGYSVTIAIISDIPIITIEKRGLTLSVAAKNLQEASYRDSLIMVKNLFENKIHSTY